MSIHAGQLYLNRCAAMKRCLNVMVVVTATCAVMMASTVVRAQGARATVDALSLAPGNTQLVVIIPSLARVNKKIAMVNTEMGLNVPGAEDMLSQLRESLGMEEGIDETRPVLIAVTGLEESIEHDAEPRAMALVPTTDYAAFAGALGGDAGGALSEVQMPDGDVGYIQKAEGYALVSNERKLIEGYEAGGQRNDLARGLGDLGNTYLGVEDVAIVLNVASLADVLLAKIDEGREEMNREFQQADPARFGGMDPAAIKGMMDSYLDMVKNVVRDSASATVGLDVSEMGAGLSFTLQFKRDSEMAGVCSTPDEGPSLLTKLPNQPYLFATSFNLEGSGLTKFFMDLIEAVPDNDQPMWKMIKQNMNIMKGVHGAAQTMLAPQQLNMAGGSIFSAVTIMKTDDAEAYAGKYAKAMKELDGVEMPLGPMPNGQPGTMRFAVQFTENAMAVDGVNVDQYNMRYIFPPEMMQAMGPMAGVMQMMGMGGQQGYMAAVGEHLVMTTSLDVQVVKEAIGAVKNGDGLGNDASFNQIRKQLPSKPHGEMYMSINGVMNTANLGLQMFGQQAVPVPENLPPIAFWVSIEDGGVAKRLYVPMPVAQFIKETAEVTVPQMMGGGAPPAGQNGERQDEGQPGRRDPSGPPPAPF